MQKRYNEINTNQNEVKILIEHRKATLDDLERVWEMNIADNPCDDRWKLWKEEYISYNISGMASTFVVVCDGVPVGEGTLLFSAECKAVAGRISLADNMKTANINALRIRKEYEGKGFISKLVRMMECYASEKGCTRLTIGVEAKETRNLAIYLHWGYTEFVMSDIDEDELVLYYAKNI